ncbi:MAG: hypothetical protein ABSC05_29640 [Candidatus Solibacter sp.]|jgi:hypothetical protein
MKLFLLFKVQQEVIEASDENVTAHTVDGQDGKSCRIGIVNRTAERVRAVHHAPKVDAVPLTAALCF